MRLNDEDKLCRLIASPAFARANIFDNDLATIQVHKSRPVYVGMSILDLSKNLLYDLYYNQLRRLLPATLHRHRQLAPRNPEGRRVQGHGRSSGPLTRLTTRKTTRCTALPTRSWVTGLRKHLGEWTIDKRHLSLGQISLLGNLIAQFQGRVGTSVNYACFVHNYLGVVSSKDWPHRKF